MCRESNELGVLTWNTYANSNSQHGLRVATIQLQTMKSGMKGGLPGFVKWLNKDGASVGGADVSEALEDDRDAIVINLRHHTENRIFRNATRDFFR